MRVRSALIRFGGCALIAFVSSLAFSQATAVLSPTSINFGPVQAAHSSTPQNVTLSNTGSATLNITSITFTGLNPTDYTQTNNCGTQVLAGGNCTIAVTFKPTRTGIRKANLTVTDDAANSPQTVALSGICQTSPLSFTPQTLTFPDQLIGTTSASQSVTVAYIGTNPLTISSIALAETNASDFSQTNNCGSGLTQGQTCTITVTFTPSGVWSRQAGIIMQDNSQGNPHIVGVQGTGVSGGIATFAPTTLTFGSTLTYNSSAPQAVKLTNTGTAALQVISVTAAGDFTQTNNCPASIASSASCTINVTFTPTFNGTRQGWVTVNFADPGGLKTVLVKGTGTLPAVVAVTPKSASVTPNQSVQYSATISGVQSNAVTWSVDGVIGGNSSVGTISAAGLYTPAPTAGRHMVTAANNANLTQTASVPVVISTSAGTLTHHNDTFRTGLNSTESALTTGNVNKNQFGKLFKYPVDGQVYAQPLWAPNVSIGGTPHNVVFVATEHDSVYAFDADNATLNPNPLWHASFTNGTTVTSIPKGDVEVGLDLSPEVGITSTPVIDAAKGVMFVEARTKDTSGTPNCNDPKNPNSPYFHYLHALDITTGKDVAGSPVLICAQVPGTGYDNASGTVRLNTWRTHQRPALLLSNGIVYLGFGALEDIDHYHGWVLGYDENTLQQVYVFNDTPNGQKGGIWQSGGGLLADATGDVYFSTGNGTFDANKSGPDYGTAFMRLTNTGGALTVKDWFTPFNQSGMNLEIINADLANSGPMLLPDQPGPIPHMAVACGKTGTIYLMNRDNLGHYNALTDNVVQAINNTIGTTSVPTGNWGTPAYFNGQIYLQGIDDPLRQYTLWQTTSTANPLLSAGPTAVSPELVGYPSPIAVVSSNGNSNGIVWEIQSDGNAGGKPATLRAYDAANIGKEIYNSGQSGTRDTAGPAVKFATPTVANGKVYVPTASEIDVYGLLP